MKKKTAHIISHSHWDREWYMPLEKHKAKLTELINDCLELFGTQEEFKSFHLDGQTIVLDDYLEIYPKMKEKVRKAVREGRFHIGPWYILQDEFLTSSESNIRNLLTGRREAAGYGALCNVGYFPDAFGSVGQMPQILRQAGMKAVAFGRGVKPVGMNNETAAGPYDSAWSEMYWESPDGSRILGILFANWYNNGMEIPVEETEAAAFWEKKFRETERFAGTSQLLFMNGCDHQPVQKNLEQALCTARKLYPDVEFVHSDFETYVENVAKECRDGLSVIRGELTSRDTDGRYTLVNTCSSRNDLKQQNRRAELALERIAEPLGCFAVLASGGTYAYPKEQLQYGWKILMQNHPHDSICCCSVDAVHEEMKIRFNKSMQVAEAIAEEAEHVLIGTLKDACRKKFGEGAIPLVVINTDGTKKSDVVCAVVDEERCYQPPLEQAYKKMEDARQETYLLVDAEGSQVDAVIRDAGVRFGYDLPKDAFRKPYMARSLEVRFLAQKVPALGYACYALLPKREKKEDVGSSVQGKGPAESRNCLENRYLRVEIQADGTLCVTDKHSGRVYRDLGYYEDTLDVGNEYIYFCPEGNAPILSRGIPAQIRLIEETPFRTEYEIQQELMIPESADGRLEKERACMREVYDRKAGRSDRKKPFLLTTRVALEKESRSVQIRTSFYNSCMDHRLRAVFTTHMSGGSHYADSVFEIVRRPNGHGKNWTNPSACEHQQYVVAMDDGSAGIAVANRGLYEYEILPDHGNAIALTLLRSVGEMGDWGVFPTPGAQCQGESCLEYELIFYDGSFPDSEAYTEASRFQTPLLARPVLGMELAGKRTAVAFSEGANVQPLRKSFLEWEGKGLALTAVKMEEEGEGLVLRFFNRTGENRKLEVKALEGYGRCFRSNVIEEPLEEIGEEAGIFRIPVRPCEIVTLLMRKG